MASNKEEQSKYFLDMIFELQDPLNSFVKKLKALNKIFKEVKQFYKINESRKYFGLTKEIFDKYSS